jgi:hypothetical protein
MVSQMNAKQAQRLALWSNGRYMLNADHTGLDLGTLKNKDAERVMDAQHAIAQSMIRRSGIPVDATQSEAIRIVLNEKHTTQA